jgi:hypothetical protein
MRFKSSNKSLSKSSVTKYELIEKKLDKRATRKSAKVPKSQPNRRDGTHAGLIYVFIYKTRYWVASHPLEVGGKPPSETG